MLAGTFLGIFFIPLFFVVVQRLFHSVPVATAPAAGAAARPSDGEGAAS
jgi:hypothetical protein